MTNRVMPQPMEFGRKFNMSMGEVRHEYESYREGKSDFKNPDNLRRIMGFLVPTWQRPLVWSAEQRVKLVESVWLGIDIGSYTVNINHRDPHYDGLLIDGQQRMWAIQQYMDGVFPVFGYHYADVTATDRRWFDMAHFTRYETNTSDEKYLREYYNLTNFGGTAHTEDQRA